MEEMLKIYPMSYKKNLKWLHVIASAMVTEILLL